MFLAQGVRDILLASTGNRNIISPMSSSSFTCSSDRAIPTSLPGGANKQKTRCRDDFSAIFTKICNSNTYTTKQLHDSVINKNGLNFVRLYFLNYTWYVNNLHNI
jgi:hypothetical protein